MFALQFQSDFEKNPGLMIFPLLRFLVDFTKKTQIKSYCKKFVCFGLIQHFWRLSKLNKYILHTVQKLMRNIPPIFPETFTLVLEFNFHVVFDVGSSAFYHLKAQHSAASTTSQVRDYFVSVQSQNLPEVFA